MPEIEVRDPRAGTQTERWVTPGHAMPPEWDASLAVKHGLYANTFVFRCTQTIAQAVASLPFRVGADPDKPNDFDPNAPLARLLGPPPGGPNPETSPRRLWAWTVAQYLITGRWAWELELVGTRPVALWPLPSHIVKPIPALNGSRYFAGFEVQTAQNRANKFTPEQLFYEWRPSAHDWREPESVLQAARLDVSVAVMSDRYDYAFLNNDARPATIIGTQQFEDRDSFEAFKNQWKAEYRGPDKAGGVAVLEHDGPDGGITVDTVGSTHRDMQSLERYDAKVRAICVAFGVPLSILGDSSARTFSNASQESINFWQGTMLPLLAELGDAINMRLAPRLGSGVGWFDLSRVEALKPAPRFTQVNVVEAVNGALATPNEGRAEMGLAEIPGGDVLRDPVAPGPATVRHVHLEGRAGMMAATRDPDEAVARRARISVSRDSQAAALEKTWQRVLRTLFVRQSKSAVSRLEGKRGRSAYGGGDVRGIGDEIFDAAHWREETENVATSLYEAAVVMGASRFTDDFGLAFDLEAPFVRDFITSRAKQLAGYVTDTTYQAITEALAEGTGIGEGIPELAARVKDVFSEATRVRATLIARTEVVSAANGGAWSVARHYGDSVVAGQEWISTNDSRTRDSHAQLDGEIIPLDGRFSNGLAYPGDPSGDPAETIHCRCTIGFVPTEAAA